MASPFGLAYGIGAGLTGVPRAYAQGQEDALTRSMKTLQLSEAQRFAEEQRSLEAALSQAPEAPKPITYTTPGVTEEQYAEMAQHDVPEGEEGPNQTYGQQIAQTRTITPFQSLAGERAAMLKKAAESQRARGFGLSASQLMTQAQAADKEHQSASALELIRAAKFGDSGRMMSAIHALGGVNARDVRPNEEGGVTLVAGDGNEVDLDESDLRAIATGSDPAEIFRQKAAITQQNKLEQMKLQAAQREQEGAVRFQQQKELLESRLNNARTIAEMRAQYQRETGQNASTAKMRDIQNYARIYMADQAKQGNPVTAEDAEAWAMNRVIGADRGRITDQDRYRSLTRDRSSLLKENPHANNPKDRDYSIWKELNDQIRQIEGSGVKPTAAPTREPKSVTPTQYTVKTDASGKVVESNDPKHPVGSSPRSGGKLVPNKTFTYSY